MKRVPGLRDLSDDHHNGLVLARRCKQAGRADSGVAPAQAWQEVREAFARHLEAHFQIEEQALLPALEAIGEGPLAVRIREEHGALRAASAEAATHERVMRFGELLEAHIRFEERQVFETTQARLPASALAAIARACEALPRSRS